MPLGPWIEHHVTRRKLHVADYFAGGKRKNVRVVTADAYGLYNRLVDWTGLPGHTRHVQLPMIDLLDLIVPAFPGPGPMVWP